MIKRQKFESLLHAVKLTQAIYLLFIINLPKIGTHTQKAKPVQGVRLRKTNIHTLTTTPNNTQQIDYKN